MSKLTSFPQSVPPVFPPTAHLFSLLLLGGLSLVAGGCGQATKTAHGPTDPVRIRWAKDPESLSPLELANQNAIDALGLIIPSLLQADVESGKMAPYLVTDLPQVSQRGELTGYTFELRPEARWSDGRPVLASDALATYKFLFCPNVGAERAATELSFIESVEADEQNPRRFTIWCIGKNPAYVTATGDIAILPEQAIDPKGSLRPLSLAAIRKPSATVTGTLAEVTQHYNSLEVARHPERLPNCGPYQLTKWESGRTLTFTRKPIWWGEAVAGQPLWLQANAQQLRYDILPDEAAATLSLRRGELDVFPNVPASVYKSLKESPEASKRLQFHSTLSHDVVVSYFNTSRPALADAATRRALASLFDASQLNQASQLGEAQQTVGIITPNDTGNYNDSLKVIAYSPEQTEAGLRQAGWARTPAGWVRKGVPLRLSLAYRAGDATYQLIGMQLRAAAQKVGIPVELKPAESTVLNKATRGGDFDMAVYTLKGNPFRFDFTGYLTKKGIGVSNIPRFSTPASDKLIEKLAAAETPEERRTLLRKFQTVMQQQMPLVPLFFVPVRVVAARELTGLHVNGLKPGFIAALTNWGDRVVTPAAVATRK
jgi:ABC-type transport system substrate-binding protein